MPDEKGDILRDKCAEAGIPVHNVPVRLIDPADLVGIPTVKPGPATASVLRNEGVFKAALAARAGRELFDAINLDCLSIDPADLRAASDVLMELALYAEFKANAMAARQLGSIQQALKFEKACDNIYQSLPEWARW